MISTNGFLQQVEKWINFYSERALNEPLLSEPVCYDFVVKMK